MTFELLEKKYLKNINTDAYLYEHEKTQAKLVFLKNDDINKSFSISFKTVPYSDNGIFHILEHSVLCGSAKYPVKEPFVELLKGSFNTFLNAMTFPDKTMYPVSSKNEKDLEILMDIYLDAVFNPNLKNNPNILAQEGWHYHLEDKKDELIYKGVVYNEMKGAYSSVDEVLDQYVTEHLFSDTSYKYSYGGKPEAIPSITQEEFLSTYDYNYHPSNSYIVLYGDINVEQYLNHIDSYLNNYEYRDYSSYKLSRQNTFTNEIKRHEYFNEDVKDKSYVAYNYILGDSNKFSEIENIDIIDDILLGSSNTEFRKFFIDNGICEDVYSYLQKDRKETVYSIIFKYVNDDKLAELDILYKNLLAKIINNGFDYEQVQASINKKNFSIKEEVNKTSSPKGVSYAIRLLRTWLYDDSDIFNAFDLDSMIDSLQQNCDRKNYENLAKQFILDNNKQVIIHLIPTTVKENREKDLVEYKNSLSDDQIEKIIEDTKKLQEWQNTPDKKEDLNRIKCVEASDVVLKNPFAETSFEKVEDINFAHFNTVTNGISYSKFLFDITDFTIEQIQYSSLLTYLLFNFNTKNKTEAEIIKDIGFNLGGLSSYIDVIRKYQSEECEVKFIITAKNLVEKVKELASILEETTLNVDFSDKDALYNVLLEIKLMLESKFKNAGHGFVARRISSYFNPQSKLASYHSEYEFYLFILDLLNNFETKSSEIINQLNIVSNLIFSSFRVLINFVGSEEEYSNYKKDISAYTDKLYNDTEKQDGFTLNFETPGYSEGFYFDSLVQYVGLGYNIDNYSGSHLVLRHILSLDYLWNNIRVKNGAYGAGAIFNAFGDFNLWSYRDPNLKETLDIYYNIDKYVKNFTSDNKEMNKYIIGTLNTLDVIMSPSALATYSLNLYLTNSPFYKYDEIVEEIKNTNVDDVNKLSSNFINMKDKAYVCVLGSKEKILSNSDLFSKTIEIK
ncbi:insulinase family protein [Gemella sanguinis]|jgi:protein hypA|uniref:insulinase family protein n=1 Tax=Gemella sanguinis TaxID=84135 RepID=UPI0004E12340|nr:insulinase family protein [Gemella sanguinis]NKZ26215.1 peptidase M16 [Gemella sanguinis]